MKIVVVGGGVTGLVAARELTASGHEVVLLEGDARLGGQILTVRLEGQLVDVGAEAIHLGAPHVAALVRSLGLAEEVVGARPGTSAMVDRRGRLVPLPAGVGPTGPTQIMPGLRSRMLSPAGLLRAGMEPVFARRGPDAGNQAVGAFVTRRFGREVTDTFVDPLLGNLHGGSVHALGLRETAPQLVPTAEQGRSLLLAAARRRKPAGTSGGQPMFANWAGGLTTFVERLAAGGGDVRTGARVAALEPRASGWQVGLADGSTLRADRVVLAIPSASVGALLSDAVPELDQLIGSTPMVSVATVVLGYDPGDAAENPLLARYNGLLLSSRQARTMKAMTNIGRKWPSGPLHLIRASVGRLGGTDADDLSDAELVERVEEDLAQLAGLHARPLCGRVVRWPQSMPQLGVGHLERVKAARAGLRPRGLHLAGCTIDGLGIGACVRSGQAVAHEISDAEPTPTASPTKGRA